MLNLLTHDFIQKDTDGDALLEDKKVQLGNDSEVLDEEEDVEDEVDDEEDASEGDESIDEDEPYVEDSKMQGILLVRSITLYILHYM